MGDETGICLKLSLKNAETERFGTGSGSVFG